MLDAEPVRHQPVLHADIALENSQGLHEPVSVNLSATVREVLPSLEPRDIDLALVSLQVQQYEARGNLRAPPPIGA